MSKVILFLFVTHVCCKNYLKQINQEKLNPVSDTISNSSNTYTPKESHKKQYKESRSVNPYILDSKENFTDLVSEKKAKLPIRLEGTFVPTKLYAQVRASNVIERVPRGEILDESEESKENAAHLKEVITNKKIATIYTEEGYEDSAYDHGGRLKNANFDENYAKKFHKKHNKKKSASSNMKNTHQNSLDADNYSNIYRKNPKTLKVIPKSANNRKRNAKHKKNKNLGRNIRKKFLKSKINPKFLVQQGIKQLERNIEYIDTESERPKNKRLSEVKGIRNLNESSLKQNHSPIKSKKLSKSWNLKYNNSDNSKEALHLEPEIKHTFRKKSGKQLNSESQKSDINHSALGRNRYDKNGHILYINPNTSKMVESFAEPSSNSNKFYKVATLKKVSSETPVISNYSNIYNEFFKKDKNSTHFKELEKKTTVKPDLFLSKMVNWHLLTRRKRNTSHASDHLQSYDAKPSDNLSLGEKEIPDIIQHLDTSLLNYFDLLCPSVASGGDKYLRSKSCVNEKFHLYQKPPSNLLHFYPVMILNKSMKDQYLIRRKRSRDMEYRYPTVNRRFGKSFSKVIDNKNKYPFYKMSSNGKTMTLEYLINPQRIPRKTFGGMEFYDSRNFLSCDDVDPYVKNLDPMNQNSTGKQKLNINNSRLPGLHTQLDCLKTKYFGNNPLDNPLFLVSQIEPPVLPSELNKTKLMSSITL